MNKNMNNNDILLSKGNISIWGYPRKIGISCFGTGSIVQVLSRSNQAVVAVDILNTKKSHIHIYIKYRY